MWDAVIQKEVAEMEGENPVYPVDASRGLRQREHMEHYERAAIH